MRIYASMKSKELRKFLIAPSEQLDEYINSKTGKQIMFNFSVGYVSLAIYLLSANPQYYWLLHTTVTAVFPIQFFLYKKVGWHYFMLEFCYSVNFYLMLYAF